MKKFFAFSLSEALIALAIIALIALLTIPSLKKAYQRHSTVSMLKKGYTALENSLDSAISKDVTLNLKRMNKDSIFREVIAPNFNITIDCASETGKCFSSEILEFDGKKANIEIKDSLILSSGISIGNNGMDYYVDINGPLEPNRLGADIFHYKLEYVEVPEIAMYYKARQSSWANLFIQPAYAESPFYKQVTDVSYSSNCKGEPKEVVFICDKNSSTCYEEKTNKYGDRVSHFEYSVRHWSDFILQFRRDAYYLDYRTVCESGKRNIAKGVPVCTKGSLNATSSIVLDKYKDSPSVSLKNFQKKYGNSNNMADILSALLNSSSSYEKNICVKFQEPTCTLGDMILGRCSDNKDQPEPTNPPSDPEPSDPSTDAPSEDPCEPNPSNPSVDPYNPSNPSDPSDPSNPYNPSNPSNPSDPSGTGDDTSNPSGGGVPASPDAILSSGSKIYAWRFIPYEHAKQIMDDGWHIKYY